MSNNDGLTVTHDEKWKNLIREAFTFRPTPIVAETFIQRWPSYSRPVAFRCSDGKEYVVKGQHAGRGIINDQIVARLGQKLSAPVGEPCLVDIPHELREIEPQLADIATGTAHGTLLVRNCSDREWLGHFDLTENRLRFASIAVLYGWCHAGDHQLIYSNDSPRLVYSVDHGHFFPSGPDWTIDTLAVNRSAQVYQEIVDGCQLLPSEVEAALLNLQRIEESDIINAVATPPDEWGITLEERVAMVKFLVNRQAELLELLSKP